MEEKKDDDKKLTIKKTVKFNSQDISYIEAISKVEGIDSVSQVIRKALRFYIKEKYYWQIKLYLLYLIVTYEQ